MLNSYKNEWLNSNSNLIQNPILACYTFIKCDFMTEPYLSLVKEYKYRNAIARLRTSSHCLGIQVGRQTRPPVPRHERLCFICAKLDDEKHFMLNCKYHNSERNKLFAKYNAYHPIFEKMTDDDKFIFLFSVNDAFLLTALGKFIFRSLNLRRDKMC